ncbi:MAG: aryl-sulfate sulfotransferase [Polyangiaceae bacterium]|nr:aryl-sulfate sulfotransferase [Polyangiaceae bacterium]
MSTCFTALHTPRPHRPLRARKPKRRCLRGCSRFAALSLAAGFWLAASGCSTSDGSEGSGGHGAAGSGGTSAVGGATGSGGSAATSSGTTAAGGALTGGQPGSGGIAASGGTSAVGGAIGLGGSEGTTGGTTGRGGSTGAGGSEGTTGGTTGRGGTAGRGGATGAGGSTRGGGTGGGAAGSGGQTASGGAAGSGGGGEAAGGSTATASCTFAQEATTSSKIATVGIVTWSTTLADLTEAHIDFGLTTSYGYTAPVDLKAADYRTLLLGMKPTKTYNYRIVASNGSGQCTSPNYTITTGSLPTGLSKITVSNKSTASPLFGGFLITGQFVQNGSSGSVPAYIVDADGDYVWVFAPGGDVPGVKMNYAGTHIWTNSVNIAFGGGATGNATVHRVSMDGLTNDNLSSKFTGQNHQLTVLPDETVAFYAYGSNGCDDIKEYSPGTGNTKTIVNSCTAIGGVSAAHVNDIQYSKDDDTLVFSELDNQVIVKVKRSDGSTVWTLNGGQAAFTGDTWKGGQHGIHVLGLDKLIFFNNNSTVNMGGGAGLGGDGSGSSAVELALDLSGKKMTKAWSYKASPSIQNDIMGDVQRLPNGNTIVAYSTKGVLHEVSADGTLLQEWSWDLGGQFGYIEKRATLYGPPPR